MIKLGNMTFKELRSAIAYLKLVKPHIKDPLAYIKAVSDLRDKRRTLKKEKP